MHTCHAIYKVRSEFAKSRVFAVIPAHNARKAAQEFAIKAFWDERSDDMEFIVVEPSGRKRSFTVDLDISVSASATENPLVSSQRRPPRAASRSRAR